MRVTDEVPAHLKHGSEDVERADERLRLVAAQMLHVRPNRPLLAVVGAQEHGLAGRGVRLCRSSWKRPSGTTGSPLARSNIRAVLAAQVATIVCERGRERDAVLALDHWRQDGLSALLEDGEPPMIASATDRNSLVESPS